MEQAIPRLRRENLKRELCTFHTDLQRKYSAKSLMRMAEQGKKVCELSSDFLSKVGARPTKPTALGSIVGDMIRRGDISVNELESLLTMVAVSAAYHPAMDAALAALEARAESSPLHCWEALITVDRLLDDVLVMDCDLKEQVLECQSALARLAGLKC